VKVALVVHDDDPLTSSNGIREVPARPRRLAAEKRLAALLQVVRPVRRMEAFVLWIANG
jgi:hypothetical protein